jgi:hypothetical protein
MRLVSEEQLLDVEVRKKIIEEIRSPENRARKDEAYKRHQCYKDQTFIYVVRNLFAQFDTSTVKEMSYAVANLAFVRKIIDKLARVYKYGVRRKIKGVADIDVAVKESEIDKSFKKTNRFLKLQRNCVQYIIPKPEGDKKTIKSLVIPPFLYDAIESDEDREKAICYVFSDYEQTAMDSGSGAGLATVGQWSPTPERHGSNVLALPVYGNKRDETIADHPADQKQFGGYVFWTKNLHFTCDEKGNIISQDIENPIHEMPVVNYAEDQDGAFWAQGGSDLVDGGILVNSLITNINHIAVTQGYGQPMWTGKNPPKQLKVGPNKVIMGEYETGDPEPKFSFISSNPPLDQLRSLIEMYVALLLTTNNLSTSGVSSNLNGGVTFPSGIAMMIDKAESMEDIEDQRQIFIDKEPEFWNIYAKWHALLKSRQELTDKLATISFPDTVELSLEFGLPKPIESEKEKLEVLKLKQELQLVTRLDMLRAEYPNLDDKQLLKKLEEILQDAVERSEDNQVSNGDGDGTGSPDDGEEGSGRVPDRADPDGRGEEEEPSNGE